MFKVRQMEVVPISTWYARRERINLDPTYQRRGTAWNQYAKAFLVDSILNGYDMPKLYFADFTLMGLGRKSPRWDYAVIDGKQRMRSIIEFKQDKIPLNDNFVYLDDPSVRAAGLRYSGLVKKYPEIAAIIDAYVLPVVSVITDEEARINDLFLRLNWSKNLTGAELRNAMQGTVPDLVRELAAHEFFVRNTSFSTDRMQDHNVAAKLLLIEFRGRLVDTKKSRIDKLVQEEATSPTTSPQSLLDFALVEDRVRADARETEVATATKRVATVLSRMVNLFATHDRLLRSPGPIPLYYWFVRNLDRSEDGTVREFLEAIARTRMDVRRNLPVPMDVQDRIREYEFHSRNINDQLSLEVRFNILNHLYRSFLSGAFGRPDPRLIP